MFYAAYKSPKKADTYLYVRNKDEFESVPEALMQSFGKPQFVMMFNVNKRKTVAGISAASFVEKIEKDGFYLQLPPKVESLLKQHKQQSTDNG